MIPGFKWRLIEELSHYIKTMPKYESLIKIEQNFNFVDSIFPPNIINWVGASLLGSLNDEINRFLVWKTDYEWSKIVPDWFGCVFLKPLRDDVLELDIREKAAVP